MQTIDLSAFFTTKTQAYDFSKRMAAVTEMIYTTSFSLEDALAKQFGIEKKDKILALLEKNEINKAATPAIKEFFEKIQETITKLPVTPLTIAFEPRDKTLTLLSDWFLLNLNQHVIFDITIDPRLIGGAAITYNGKYLDFSIRKQFEQIVKTNLSDEKTPPQEQKEQPQQAHQSSEHLHMGR